MINTHIKKTKSIINKRACRKGVFLSPLGLIKAKSF